MIIIGLGNPGKEYDGTRHNLGFAAVDAFWKKYADAYDLSAWKKDRDVLVSKSRKLMFIKPQTFMNKSGEALQPYKKSIKKSVIPSVSEGTRLIVVHDDLDLPTGMVRVSVNKSSAGHKGVQSIIDHLGTQDFIRIRLGIAPTRRTKPADQFVLERFTKVESKKVSALLSRAHKAIKMILDDGLEKAMSIVNAKRL